jgi:CHAD domain-containing protein
MAYRLEDQETVADGIARVAAEELDDAIDQLRNGIAQDPVTAVHEARKGLKKERALLRLVRPSLDRATFRAQNARLRDAGRSLSALRDAQVADTTIDGLAERYAGQLPRAAFLRVRRAVKRHAHPSTARLLRATASRVATDVEAARDALGDWTRAAGDWPALQDGLERTYRDGRDALAVARRDPTDEHLHEWRKRVKDLWYHQRLLRPLWPGVMTAQEEELDILGELLGVDQDLANLRRTLSGDEAVRGDIPDDVDRLVELIDGRRGQLREQALALGGRVYAEKPGAYVRRHRAYARAWERERDGAAAVPA